MLPPAEDAGIHTSPARVVAERGPELDADDRAWLAAATARLGAL
jgi:hypothetical protein